MESQKSAKTLLPRDLLRAREGLRPVSVGDKREPWPHAHQSFFAEHPGRRQASPWDRLDPCRVTPVWKETPKLEAFTATGLAALVDTLERHGYKGATLSPMLAGYSGAQPFVLQSSQGRHFLKAAVGDKGLEVTKTLEREFRVAQWLNRCGDSAETFHLLYVSLATDPTPVAFFVAEFTAATHISEEPLRHELFALAQGSEAGPLLQGTTRLWQAFHRTPLGQAKEFGAVDLCQVSAWKTTLLASANKGLLGGKELATLVEALDKIVAAFGRRGGHLHKNQVFLHGDMHASNIRFDADKKRVVAIDFGNSGQGDPARELAYFFFMLDVPMAYASPWVRLYQAEVKNYPEAFCDRTLLALAGERIARYARILGWSGRDGQAARDYQQRIEHDLAFVAGWL